MGPMPVGDPSAPLDPLTIDVAVGRRVVVVANLMLSDEATTTSTWATAGFARALDAWEGPGLVVVAGNLFDLDGADDPGQRAERALAAHARLASSLTGFAAGDERRVVVLPGHADAAVGDKTGRAVVEALGATVAPHLDLKLSTAAGDRLVRIEARHATGAPGGRTSPMSAVARRESAPWQEGSEMLADPATLQRFLTSRVLYRRFAKLAWWLLAPLAVALALAVPFVTAGLLHLFGSSPRTAHALHRVRQAAWGTRLLVVVIISTIELVLLAAILGLVARGAWKSLGGGRLAGPFDESLADEGSTANDAARDAARTLMEHEIGRASCRERV
jgi:hypothetical protein